MKQNGVMLQAFEWFSDSGGGHYNYLNDQILSLSEAGFSALWLPPASKATGTNDVGYGIYDLWDLGEFDQKGSVRTKYGTKEDYLALIKTIHDHGLQAYADVVLNHKASADEEETFQVVRVDQQERNKVISGPFDIRGWTRFTFPGRAGKYSDFTWNFNHFSGIDFDSLTGQSGVYKILGDNKDWAVGVSNEFGNYDYLMFADIDHSHPEVDAELKRWAEWFIETTGVDGFRFDALKHINDWFIRGLISSIKEKHPDFYFVGEYWVFNDQEMKHYLDQTRYGTDLFDVGLHQHFKRISSRSGFDMNHLFSGTLVESQPSIAVTFVDNHDTQPGQALEGFVDDWFKQSAYAIILLRKVGYPCVFFGDYYGLGEPLAIPSKKDMIDTLLYLRKTFAYGEETDYPGPDYYAWTRLGDDDHPGRLAVLVNTGEEKTISLFVGEDQAGKTYKDYTGNQQTEVVISGDGSADFPVHKESISAYADASS